MTNCMPSVVEDQLVSFGVVESYENYHRYNLQSSGLNFQFMCGKCSPSLSKGNCILSDFIKQSGGCWFRFLSALLQSNPVRLHQTRHM